MLDKVGMKKNWLWFVGFAVVWLALRVFWLDGDSGIPSFWEYGYHVTDEGYYLSGGKELYLWNSAVDLARGECPTYGYAPGMNWLSLLGHKLFGLSTWTWRIPFFAIYFLGAIMAFWHVSRRSGSRFAFMACTSMAIFPLLVVYERSASNDTLMMALLIVSYVLAFGRGVWRIPLSALVVSSLVLIKPAVWALLPVTLSGVLSERKTRSGWLDAGLFLALAIAMAFGWKSVAAFTVSGDAARLGMSSWDVLKNLTANYGLPDFFNFAKDFKAFAAFPRDPSYRLLGPIALFISAFPFAFLLRQVARRKWNAHMLLYLALPAYVGAASVMNTLYSHYYLPMIGLLPIVLSAMREDLADEPLQAVNWRALAIDAAIVLAVGCLGLFCWSSSDAMAKTFGKFYSRIYNLPAENPWALTGGSIAIGVVAGLALLAVRRGWSGLRQDGVAAGLCLFVTLSVVCATYPAVHMAPLMHVEASSYLSPMAINLLAGGVVLFVLFVHQELSRRGLVMAFLLPVFVLMTYIATPTWRSAAVELLQSATRMHAEVAKELRQLVPEGSVVIGERTDQAFMSLPIRTATTILSNSDPTPVIEALWKRDPSLKLFAFADSQHAYNLKHYQEHKNEFHLQLVKTFKLPSFGTGKPADVHFCRIVDLRPRAK